MRRFLDDAPIAPAQLGVAGFALADFLWVARPSVIGWPPFLRGALLALALGATVGFAVGLLAQLALAGAPGLRRPRPGAVVAAPAAMLIWAAAFSGAVLWAAFRLSDPALAAWAVALVSIAAIGPALLGALVVARIVAPLSRPHLGGWLALVLAAAGAAATPWIRPLGLGAGALAIALLAARARPIRPRITGIAAAVGAAIALSPLCDEPVARIESASFVPAIEALLSPVIDLDGDGRLPVFGSGDCEEGDAAVSEAAVEIAGDGVDQDCRFGDLPVAPEPPETRGPRARAVLLLTIRDLDLGDGGALRPKMPALEKAMAPAVRFTGSRGIAGRFVDVAPVLIDGSLPLELAGDHGGFALDGRTIPALVEGAGGRAAMSASDSATAPLNTAFHPRRMWRKENSPEKTARRFAQVRGRPGFLWVHLEGEDLDAAAAALIARARRQPETAVLLVGLPSRARSPEVGGGPLALWVDGLEAAIDARPAGLHDVYPTLADLFGFEIQQVAGRSLLRPAAAAIAGSIEDGVAAIGAFDRDGWVLHRPRSRRFESSAGGFAEGARGPEAVADLAAITRDRVLAPRLAALNRRRQARVDGLPDALVGTPSTIARALTVHGCTVDHRPAGVVLDVYFSGAGLEDDDRFAFKLFAPGATSVRGLVHPAVPLSTLEPGAIYRHRFDLDTRSLAGGSAFLWLGVSRGGEHLPVTGGSGATPEWALVCRVETETGGGP